MNLVFFGMSGPLSRVALEALIGAGLIPRAIVTPALAGGPTLATPRSIGSSMAFGRRPLPSLSPLAPVGLAALASEHALPVIEVRSARSPDMVDEVRRFMPDLVAVVCFPWRLPEELLYVPRLGCVNLHPSLLPENRGPDPLFWTFRHGDIRTGVTAHLMTTQFDAGPVVRQAELPVEDGLSEALLERRCADLGGRVLVEAISGLADGSLKPAPQDERRATYFGQPGPLDYVIEPEWSARRCENFTRGVIGRGQPILLRVDGTTYRVVEPLGVSDDDPAHADQPRGADGTVVLRRPPGVWRARVTPL